MLTASVATQSLQVVQALHASSVSHRSLAPSKVLVTSDSRLKINGLGVAPMLHASLGQTSGGARTRRCVSASLL